MHQDVKKVTQHVFFLNCTESLNYIQLFLFDLPTRFVFFFNIENCTKPKTFSLNQTLGRFSLLITMSVCLCDCASAGTQHHVDRKLLIEDSIANITKLSHVTHKT